MLQLLFMGQSSRKLFFFLYKWEENPQNYRVSVAAQNYLAIPPEKFFGCGTPNDKEWVEIRLVENAKQPHWWQFQVL